MIFDIFFSICQTPVQGSMPNEKGMFKNFFEQVRLADELGFQTAWVAETHLSCQVQKRNPGAVIPHFEGEIGLNTDILQLAHKIFAQTKRIHVGSAIRNILANGGPMAHAEAIRMFLTLHSLDEKETRRLNIGFAAGRFPFSNTPYGIRPRNDVEKIAWPALRGLIFQQATEMFLRFLKGDIFSSQELSPILISRANFRSDEDWQAVLEAQKKNSAMSLVKNAANDGETFEVPPFWQFDQVGVIPFEANLKLLDLTIGSHEARVQNTANGYLPCGVFNLSITPDSVIEETHERMQKIYNAKGAEWKRSLMPRTVLVFINSDAQLAKSQAQDAMQNYWKAMEGTIDPVKVQAAVDNALVGTPEMIRKKLKANFHQDDRLMLWFDFNNHDSADVMHAMKQFHEEVING